MIVVGIAVLLAVFSIMAGKGGKKGVSLTFGIISILTFIYWLNSGPGHEFLNWLENPTGPEIPDSVPIPGR